MSRDRTDPTLDRALSDVPDHLDQSRSPSVSQQIDFPRDISGADARQPTGGRSRPWDDVDLPRSLTRKPVDLRDKTINLRESESRILATVGAFRVVSAPDLLDPDHDADRLGADLRHLVAEGLIEHRHIVINDLPTAVVALTRDGKALLDSHHQRPADRTPQVFHAGFVKPRELAHDAQLYRLYRAEAQRIEAAGGTVRRVVLDYEIKRDYQRFLQRPSRRRTSAHDTGPSAPAVQKDRAAELEQRRLFAEVQHLPIVDGHLEIPDLRIEYETTAGELLYRDVELVTQHYSRGQMSGKRASGFTLYRAAGATSAGTAGGAPYDPHHLEWLS